MRYVEFDPENLEGEQADWWKAWKKRSEDGLKKLKDRHREGKKLNFNSKIWKDLKVWLLRNVFLEKCAYCEGIYTAGTHDAAEHWRPKGEVTVDGAVLKDENDVPHPGYWWLAYEWRNLVPSCDLCNGEPGGKMNEFPVENEYVFEHGTSIEDLDKREKPLLLHPYDPKNSPESHLKFERQGVVAPKNDSKLGENSIKVLNLARGSLNEERAAEQEKAKPSFFMAFFDALRAENPRPVEESMPEYLGPKARYSQAIRGCVPAWTKEAVKKMKKWAGAD